METYTLNSLNKLSIWMHMLQYYGYTNENYELLRKLRKDSRIFLFENCKSLINKNFFSKRIIATQKDEHKLTKAIVTSMIKSYSCYLFSFELNISNAYELDALNYFLLKCDQRQAIEFTKITFLSDNGNDFWLDDTYNVFINNAKLRSIDLSGITGSMPKNAMKMLKSISYVSKLEKDQQYLNVEEIGMFEITYNNLDNCIERGTKINGIKIKDIEYSDAYSMIENLGPDLLPDVTKLGINCKNSDRHFEDLINILELLPQVREFWYNAEVPIPYYLEVLLNSKNSVTYFKNESSNFCSSLFGKNSIFLFKTVDHEFLIKANDLLIGLDYAKVTEENNCLIITGYAHLNMKLFELCNDQTLLDIYLNQYNSTLINES